jgi:hypothetical protein
MTQGVWLSSGASRYRTRKVRLSHVLLKESAQVTDLRIETHYFVAHFDWEVDAIALKLRLQ